VIALLGTVLLGATKTMVISMLSEKIILKLGLEIAEWAAKRSSNKIDDRLVLLMKEQLQETQVI
tara:strand:- start:131 stop:322 length:192 start_codon:yes stop_codon:yes gene_type:complete